MRFSFSFSFSDTSLSCFLTPPQPETTGSKKRTIGVFALKRDVKKHSGFECFRTEEGGGGGGENKNENENESGGVGDVV